MIDSIQKFQIEGLLVIEPHIFKDSRGYFYESYSKADFEKIGIKCQFVQDNESKSCQNVIRGLHLQMKHPQAKLVRVVKGEIYDVAVDLRKGSKTFGQWQGVILSEENKKMFFIPKGFAHGFAVISKEAVFNYKCDDVYCKEGESGIAWDDPELKIDWGNYVDLDKVILSEKDKHHQTLKEWRKTNE